MLDPNLEMSNYTENYYCHRTYFSAAPTGGAGTGSNGSESGPGPPPPDSPGFAYEFESSLFEVIVKGYLTTAVALLGIVGNCLSAFILTRPKMRRSSLNHLLLGLTLCDTLLIINTIFILGLDAVAEYHHFDGYTQRFIPLVMPYMYPIGTTAQTGSIYFTLVVTVERWMAVSYPLRAKYLCTLTRARWASVGIATFAALYNVPKWFEFRTGKLGMGYDIIMTKLRCNGTYIRVYINWSNLWIMYLFPICALIVLNTVIYMQIRKTNATRAQLTKHQSNELSLAGMLVVIVLVYLFCNILPFVNNFMESTTGDPIQELVHVSNLLVTFNSSVNCIIYCTLGVKFRKQFFKLISWNRGGAGAWDSSAGGAGTSASIYRGTRGGRRGSTLNGATGSRAMCSSPFGYATDSSGGGGGEPLRSARMSTRLLRSDRGDGHTAMTVTDSLKVEGDDV